MHLGDRERYAELAKGSGNDRGVESAVEVFAPRRFGGISDLNLLPDQINAVV